MIRIWALYLDFEGAKDIHVLQVLNLGFGGHWVFLTGSWHWILIWIWWLVFENPMFQILDLCLHYKGAKNIHVL